MATMEKVSGNRKRPADTHGGQPGAKQIADVPAEPPVAEQSNPDIALRSALRRLRSNMLKIGERQVATSHELWSLLEEQKELRGMLSARTPLQNSIETFLDLLEALLRAKLQLR
uniref:(northern house mosquito) hypothetical protein n=1 Tax=Culex pipiens TaxID=7175 RepID=A0A8D7ZXW9_CULPI